MKAVVFGFFLLFFGANAMSQTVTLSGNAGKWKWDGKYVTNYSNSSIKWEWDGTYIKNYRNSSQKWKWDGKYLTNYQNSSEKWQWDGTYLKNYRNSSEKVKIASGAPIPVWAVIHGIVR